MSIPALVIVSVVGVAYLVFGVCLAMLATGFGEPPSNWFARVGLRLGLIFAWPLAIPTAYLVAFVRWLFS